MEWREWPRPQSDQSAGVVLGDQRLEEVIRSIHDQLQYLKSRPGENSRPGTAEVRDADAALPKAVVRELMGNLRALEAKLVEKDKFYMSIVDELNTKLYFMESRMDAQSAETAQTKASMTRGEERMSAQMSAWEDLHSSFKMQLDGFELQMHRDRKSVDAQTTAIESLRSDIQRLQNSVDAMQQSSKKDEMHSAALASELKLKFAQLQDAQSGCLDRLNKAEKDFTQLAYGVGEARHGLEQLRNTDITAMHALIEGLRVSKADLADMDLKADQSVLETKADQSELGDVKEQIRSIHAQLTHSMSSLDTKLHKKFSRLSDFTVKQLRQLPAMEQNVDMGDTAGAGKMKCLVCDTPIKSIEGSSPVHPAKFYNTIGMLRYRNSFDDKGQREELRRVHEECAPAVSNLSMNQFQSAQQLSILEAIDPPVQPKPIYPSKYDAVFEYVKFSKRRPLSAPMGRSRSGTKIPSKSQS